MAENVGAVVLGDSLGIVEGLWEGCSDPVGCEDGSSLGDKLGELDAIGAR